MVVARAGRQSLGRDCAGTRVAPEGQPLDVPLHNRSSLLAALHVYWYEKDLIAPVVKIDKYREEK